MKINQYSGSGTIKRNIRGQVGLPSIIGFFTGEASTRSAAGHVLGDAAGAAATESVDRANGQ